jgi:hypothetical protein
MEPGIPNNIVYAKLLEKVIIKCVYDQDDNFLFWSLFTNNPKTIKSIFPDVDITNLCFNVNLDTEFETFDLKLGKKVIINLNKLDCISIPELPFEFSPVFMFNEKFEPHIKKFPFQKIQRKTILELKKYSIVTDKNSSVLTPKVLFLEKVKPGCDVLKISTLESLSNKKSVLKISFTNYKKELNKHFKFLFSEFDQERKVLEKRLSKGCPFSSESLKTLAELEDAAKKEQESIDIKNYLIPLDMLTSWPKCLLPSPEWIINDDSIINNINNFKGCIIYNKDSFVTYYTSIAQEINNFYKYNVITKSNNSVEVKLIGIKINEHSVEVISIPTIDYVAQQIVFDPFSISINTNSYAINHLLFERDETGKLVDNTTNFSIDIENDTIYLKNDDGNLLFEATKQWPEKLSIQEVTDQLNKFLVVG